MTKNLEIIFTLLQSSSTSEHVELSSQEDLEEASDIAELVRFAEAIQEPDPATFLVG